MVATDLETIWVGTADEIDLLRRTLAQRFPHLELVVGTAYDGDLELTEIRLPRATSTTCGRRSPRCSGGCGP